MFFVCNRYEFYLEDCNGPKVIAYSVEVRSESILLRNRISHHRNICIECSFSLCEGVARIFWAWPLPFCEIQVPANVL